MGDSPVFIGARRDCLGELGVSSLKVSRLNCVGEGEALDGYAITAREELEAYLDYIPHYLEDGMPVPILTLSGLFRAYGGGLSVGAERHPEGEDCGRRAVCPSARTTMYLGPDGRILPCIPMSERDSTSGRFPLLGEVTLAEALSDSFYMDFVSTTLDDYLARNPGCAACAYKNRCGGGCRGRAVEANGGSDLVGRRPGRLPRLQGWLLRPGQGDYRGVRVLACALGMIPLVGRSPQGVSERTRRGACTLIGLVAAE